jgi:GDP-L-fucose synthase
LGDVDVSVLPLEGKRIWVAGQTGMVGSALVRRLSALDVTLLSAPRATVDLRDRAATKAWAINSRPDLVFVAAAKVGGILANDTQPVQFLQDNLDIELSTIAAAYEAGVEKLLFLGSSCMYPKHAAQPLREDSLLASKLEPTNQWYAVAKIAGAMLCDAYRKQYGANYISVLPTNLYGPNDNFDSASSHVMAAAIRKIAEAVEAGSRSVTIWGSGTPLREFMHVDDLADALVFLMQVYSEAGPINVGSGQEISILQLHELIADIAGYKGTFRLDPAKPDGTPRKLMDSSRLQALGWQPKIKLRDGVAEIYEAYKAQKMHS